VTFRSEEYRGEVTAFEVKSLLPVLSFLHAVPGRQCDIPGPGPFHLRGSPGAVEAPGDRSAPA